MGFQPSVRVKCAAFVMCLVLVVVLAPVSVAQPVKRLQGLERLYFEHVGGTDDHSEVPLFLAKSLPPEIRTGKFSPQKTAREVMDGELELHVETRDFNLPLQPTSSDLWLRQVIVGTGAARITRLWWALYDHGQQSDVWSFSADPERTNTKALSNYEIEAATATANAVSLQVYGSMFRPGGAWWITGKIFSFSMQNETLRLSRVLNAFGFFQGYEVRDTHDLVDVITEQEVSGRFQIQNYDKIQESILQACRFRGPFEDDWDFNWAHMEAVTRCIAKKVKPATSYRNFDQPSFIERGGR